jgi:multidrug efflux pump subunit AcrA (membrane-fusion protein)
MRGTSRALALVATACALAIPSARGQSTPTPLAVLVQPAEVRPLAGQREFIGRAQAADKVDLRARVQGFLGARRFADGDIVKEGQVLFVIEPEPYQAEVEQKEGQRAAAAATLINAELQYKRADRRPDGAGHPRREESGGVRGRAAVGDCQRPDRALPLCGRRR